MRDALDLGQVPSDEPCAQVGADDYADRARPECRAYVHQLVRQFGEPPAGARFRVASNPHDFGSYLSVEIVFDDSDQAAIEYAFNAENNLPAKWDMEARKELRQLGADETDLQGDNNG